MHVSDVLVLATVLFFCIVGVAAPLLFVARAFRSPDSLERIWLVAGALGLVLFAFLQLEIAAHRVVPTLALVAWIAKPLAIYAAATEWLYTSIALSLWAGVSLTLMILGFAATRGSHRADR